MIWQEGLAFGDLPLDQRKRVSCISRRHGVPVRANLTRDEWLDLLPVYVSAQIIELS